MRILSYIAISATGCLHPVHAIEELNTRKNTQQNDSSNDHERNAFVTVELKQILGASATMEWCNSGIGGAVLRLIKAMLSSHSSPKEVKQIVSQYLSLFHPTQRKFCMTNEYWVKQDCNPPEAFTGNYNQCPFLAPRLHPICSKVSASSKASGNTQNRNLQNPSSTIDSDKFSGIKTGQAITQVASQVASQDTNSPLHQIEAFDAFSGTHPDAINHPSVANLLDLVGLAPDPVGATTKYSDEAVLSLGSLFPFLLKLIDFEPGTPLRDRLESFSDRVCRFSDLEAISGLANIPDHAQHNHQKLDGFGDGLDAKTPATCSVLTLLNAITVCSPKATDTFHLPTCREFEKRWDSRSLLPNFPKDEPCYPTKTSVSKVRYRQSAVKNNERGSFASRLGLSDTLSGLLGLNLLGPSPRRPMSSFVWSDENVHMDLNLNQLAESLPRYISIETRTSELMTYLSLFRATFLMMEISLNPWADCETKLFDKSRFLVPGWALTKVVNLRAPLDLIQPDKAQGKVPADSKPPPHPILTPPEATTFQYTPETPKPYPFAGISVDEENPCHILIVFKGTSSSYEWVLNFQMWHTVLPELNFRVHGGYALIWTSIAPVLIEYIKSQLLAHTCACNQTTRIIVSGHSLGAAVAQIGALHFHNKFVVENACNIAVEAVLFGLPRSLGNEASEYFAKNINGRALIDVNDPLYHVPCHERNSIFGTARCPRNFMLANGIGRDNFAENYGLILLDVDFSKMLSNNEVSSSLSGSTRALKRTTGSFGETITPFTPEGDDLGSLVTSLHMQIIPMTSNSTVKNKKVYSLSPFLSRIFTLAAGFLLTPSALVAIPKSSEIISAHVCSYACGLSSACHGLPWSNWRWLCSAKLLEDVTMDSAA